MQRAQRSSIALGLLLLAGGCGQPPPAASPTAAKPSNEAAGGENTAPSTPAVPRRLSELPLELHPEFNQDFAAEHVSGAIALFDAASGVVSCSDEARCRRPQHPASTFKIANSIIALETGVASEPETSLPWDGTERAIEDWNRDHTLRSAIQVSCVPCFQEIARKVGEARMAAWVKQLEYGNADISGAIDTFWLVGGLRISPVQQLEFLRRLDRAELPIQPFVRDMVIDMLTLDVGDDYVLRGKTGSLSPPEAQLTGWFVGWVERDAQRWYFATLVDGVEPGVDFLKARRRVTERVLRRIGGLPPA
jgi:beta-lactamase class D